MRGNLRVRGGFAFCANRSNCKSPSFPLFQRGKPHLPALGRSPFFKGGSHTFPLLGEAPFSKGEDQPSVLANDDFTAWENWLFASILRIGLIERRGFLERIERHA